jgi:hypothetical protein
MKHLAVKWGVWLALLAAAAVTLQVSLTAFVVLSTLTLCSAFARISDAAADCFAPEDDEEPCDHARLTVAAYCDNCRTVQTGGPR